MKQKTDEKKPLVKNEQIPASVDRPTTSQEEMHDIPARTQEQGDSSDQTRPENTSDKPTGPVSLAFPRWAVDHQWYIVLEEYLNWINSLIRLSFIDSPPIGCFRQFYRCTITTFNHIIGTQTYRKYRTFIAYVIGFMIAYAFAGRKQEGNLWWRNDTAKSHGAKVFAELFFLLAIIGCLMMEVAFYLGKEQTSVKESGLYTACAICAYLGSLIFIVLACCCSKPGGENERVILHATTGSLYLKYGCIGCGVFGLIHTGHQAWNAIWNDQQNQFMINSLTFIFICAEGFIVWNSARFSLRKPYVRFGLMLLIATNLWTWIRFMLTEEIVTLHEIATAENRTNLTTCEILFDIAEAALYTCIVEFSLICAAVGIVIWANLEQPHDPSASANHNISRSSDYGPIGGGLAGLVFVAMAIGLAQTFRESKKELHLSGLNTAFSVAEILPLATSLLAIICLIRLFYTPKFQISGTIPVNEKSARLMDKILLTIAFIGIMIYNIGALIAVISPSTTTNIILLIELVMSTVEILLQTAVIWHFSKLKQRPGASMRWEIELTTFLFGTNICMFLMNVVEAHKPGSLMDTLRAYGDQPWALLVLALAPLMILYRFHSVVCFEQMLVHSLREPHVRIPPPNMDQIGLIDV